MISMRSTKVNGMKPIVWIISVLQSLMSRCSAYMGTIWVRR
jgi:hypothetical protein